MSTSGPSAPQKRKQPPRSVKPPSKQYPAKRVKTSHARKILTQTSEKALSKNGDLDVSAFVKAREFEIKALGKSMGESKNFLSKRAFQQVPKDMRRRTASHNVKRVPKRLRARAAREMRDDNTPTVTSRRRKPTPHQRLRLEKAKELKKLGVLTKKKRDGVKKQKAGKGDPEKAGEPDSEKTGEQNPEEAVSSEARLPKLKKNVLAKPAKPPARFRKRQVHKSWLPTHLYHAKRAHMTPPKEPLWRFAIPLTPTDKCYRTTHRAASLRGCVAWDMSYMGTIGIEGVESSILGLLRSIGVDEKMLVGKREAKWRNGTRSWEGWVRERDNEKRCVAQVAIMWCSDNSLADEKDNNPAPANEEVASTSALGKKKAKRKLFIRVHSSAFFPVWNEILKVAKIQRPPVMVEDLRFDIGSIEITGPESTEALLGALHPSPALEEVSEAASKTADDGEWVDIDLPQDVWPRLVGVTNPATLPTNAILGFNVSDPRLHQPPRPAQHRQLAADNDSLLELLSSWPPDQTKTAYDIFERTKRLTASHQLASQKAINRRKGDAPLGTYPSPSPKDPKIPVLLMVSRSPSTAGQGSWTVILPWSCILPVWYSLMHYPLSSGGNPRFGGLQEKRQLAFEHGSPWYPADYPGTKAGFEWELLERGRRKDEWEKRPKGKRIAWESVDLGNGRKGEIGMGWACDWERLLQGSPSVNAEAGDESTTQKVADTKPKEVLPPESKEGQTPTGPLSPPLDIFQTISPAAMKPPILSTALSTVHLTLLNTGHPARNARIYRLPTTNSELRAKWFALSHPTKSSKSSSRPRPTTATSKDVAPHERTQMLAASLLRPTSSMSESVLPKPADTAYPHVPDEVDLVGFVTTGNYHLGEGKCEAIGNVAVAKVMADQSKEGKNLCIVREAGQNIGRLARWKFV